MSYGFSTTKTCPNPHFDMINRERQCFICNSQRMYSTNDGLITVGCMSCGAKSVVQSDGSFLFVFNKGALAMPDNQKSKGRCKI